MIINYEGQAYEFDFDDITVKQAIKVEKHTGLKLTEWGDALAKGNDLTAMQAFGWLVLHGGADIPIEECDFKIVRLGEAFTAAAEKEAEAQKAAEAARPTPPLTPQNGSGDASIQDLNLPSSLTA